MKYIILTILLALGLSACHEAGPEVTVEPATAPTAVVVYMAANNSLGRDGKDAEDIVEMKKAAGAGALADGSRVLIYRAEYGSGRQRLCELKADTLLTLREYTDLDVASTDPERMRRVLADARALAPATKYGLVLWSHALGWTNATTDPRRAPQLRSFGDDYSADRKMPVSELGAALDPGAWDYICFDCCLMGSVEVAYELRHATPLIYASVTETPYDGLVYDEALPLLIDGSAEALKAICRLMLEHYGASTLGSCPVSASVISTGAIDDLAAATAAIYDSANPLPDDFSPQQFYFSYRFPEYKYNDLEQYVEAVCSDDEALARWRDALARTVLFQTHSDWVWSTYHIKRHCGLSTRIVHTAEQAATLGYDGLQWWADVVSHLPGLK